MPVQSLIPGLKIVQALPPAADAAGRASEYVSLIGVRLATIVVHINQGNAATIQLSINQAKDVSGTSSKAIVEAVPIWSNEDAANSTTLTKQTASVSYTTSSTTAHKIVVFHIDPMLFGVNDGYTAVALTTGASNAANITQATALLQMVQGH